MPISARVLYFSLMILSCICAVFSCADKNDLKVVTVGLNSTRYLIENMKDSFSNKPPAPPARQNILTFNFFQSADDKVYFYNFPVEPKVCGYMLSEKDSAFEYNLERLKRLNNKDIIEVTEENIENLVQSKILKQKEEERYIAIGINDESTNNRMIISIIKRLSKEAYAFRWKVRSTNQYELSILK